MGFPRVVNGRAISGPPSLACGESRRQSGYAIPPGRIALDYEIMSTTLVPNSLKRRRQNGNIFPAPGSRGTAASVARSAEPGTIAICFVAAALESVRARGLNADEMLANVGLSPSLLQVPQARVSAKHYGALWRTIALALDDEFFGP